MNTFDLIRFAYTKMSIHALSNKEDNAVALLKSIGQLENKFMNL